MNVFSKNIVELLKKNVLRVFFLTTFEHRYGIKKAIYGK